MLKLSKRKILIICLAVLIIAIAVLFCFHIQEEREKQEIKTLLNRLTEAVNLMDSAREKMPQDLLEVHEFLVKLNQEGKFKLYQIHPELKGQLVMYHGVKNKGIYVDPSLDVRTALWIPIFYHEAGHLYWHSKNPVETFEEFQQQLFDSEEHSYIVQSQAWNIVKDNFSVGEKDSNSLELKLFKNYERDASFYNRMVEGDLKAIDGWYEIIKEDIKVQKEQQELLK